MARTDRLKVLSENGLRVESLTYDELRLVTSVAMAVINVIGVVVCVLLALVIVPLPSVARSDSLLWNDVWLISIVVAICLVIGTISGRRVSGQATEWLWAGRPPTDLEKADLLGLPRKLFIAQGSLWLAGSLFFGYFNSTYNLGLGFIVLIIGMIGGLITTSISYLVAERLVRPLARVAFISGLPERMGMRLGVRTFLAWLLGSGTVIIGIGLLGLRAAGSHNEISAQRFGVTIVVLSFIAFCTGGVASYLASKATTDPVSALRHSVHRVQAGDLDADVPIYDSTELGILQSGFNEMLAGLRERESIRDLFGRHVGPDVARAALQNGVKLGGELRRVGVLFVDIVGSTSYAINRPPEEVVSMLNRFFDVVIEVVDKNGGWINKFEGDAALAIWGAPTEQWGIATDLLRAGRELGARLAAEMPDIRAGIGISVGHAVAGNVGASRRYEYTVIGDAVNEAARLSDLAKTYDGMVLARGDMLTEARSQGKPGEAEVRFWQELTPVKVRGRGSNETPLAAPLV